MNDKPAYRLPTIANTAFGKTVHVRFGTKLEAACPLKAAPDAEPCGKELLSTTVAEQPDASALAEWIYCPVHGVVRHVKAPIDGAYEDPVIERGVHVLLGLIGQGIVATWPSVREVPIDPKGIVTPEPRTDLPSTAGGLVEGWAQAAVMRVPHYFRDHRSLCGRWAFMGNIISEDQAAGQGPDDCKDCWRVLKRERAATARG